MGGETMGAIRAQRVIHIHRAHEFEVRALQVKS